MGVKCNFPILFFYYYYYYYFASNILKNPMHPRQVYEIVIVVIPLTKSVFSNEKRLTCDVRGFLGDESPKCPNFYEKKKRKKKPTTSWAIWGWSTIVMLQVSLVSFKINVTFNINIEFVIDGF
jgi:hypothetical protein